MPNSTTSGPKIPYCAARQLRGFHEPMKSRAYFYLDQIAKRKSAGEDLSQCDINAAIGRAYRDRCEDDDVVFDSQLLKEATDDAAAGRRVRPLKDAVDAV